jgi:2-polyprenyl-3-methyl-5-hydroxy-6-metoxy-1,4-benzoquinol methylase
MFLRVGEGCAKHIDEKLRSMSTSLADKRVLDFGCGCGRILRWLSRSYPTTRFWGADVDEAAIEWCIRNMQGSVFVKSRPEPPLPFESNYFDVVYCFSVFTHLDELMQDFWLAEIKRIVSPGGMVILTVHGSKAAEGLDEKGAEELRRKGFLHRRSRKLSGLVPEWYNTTWHSEGYIVNRLEALFTDVHYTVVPDGNQDLVAARCIKDPL